MRRILILALTFTVACISPLAASTDVAGSAKPSSADLSVADDEPPLSLEEQAALEEVEAQEYLNNLDSILNLWYVRHSLEDSVDLAIGMALDDTAEVVSEVNDSLYISRLAQMNSLVNLNFNDIVRKYINVYTQRKRGQMGVMLGLADYYFPMFEEILDRYQLPVELKALPVIESALNPRAVSPMGATGLWQMMYTTGRHYGLRVTSYVDERRDPLLSTVAAARYLRDLYKIYGDWTLVIAAYNCGPGNVNKAIRRSGGKTNYWDIYYYLPRETRGYVPAFIAATYALAYASEHGISPTPISFPAIADTVEVKGRLHLEQVASVLDMPIQQLRDLNPQYKRDLLPSPKRNVLRLPMEQVGAFIDNEDSIKAYKDDIYLATMDPREPAEAGKRAKRAQHPRNRKLVRYRVRSGDVLLQIARRYKVKVSQLKRWNGIRGSRINAGQMLKIYVKK